ncbi:MAG: 1-acyl-sn-glycerol-3-phosphate acyltransferase [Acidobacteriota bacterium]
MVDEPAGGAEGSDRLQRRLRAAQRFARFMLELFFRRIEVVGAEKIPADGALLVVGNHGSGMLDPGLFLAFLPRPPRFLALSTLWDIPALRPMLALGAAIPIYQRESDGDASSKNQAVFAKCYEALGAGGVIGLFPEGHSHHEPAMTELKTGAARIALETMKRYPDMPLRLVPVGLTFEEKTRFRSRVLVTVGDAFEPLDALGATGLGDFDVVQHGAEREAVSHLTACLQDALTAVTLNYPSWREAELIERAVAIFERPRPEVPAEPDLAPSFKVRQLFIEEYLELQAQEPRRLAALRQDVEAYDAELDVYQLRDEQVVAAYPQPVVLRFVGRTLRRLLWQLPLGLVGTVLGFLPFWVCDVASKRSPEPDTDSTYKIVAGLIFYPLFWLLQGLALGWWLGPWWGVGAALLGPLGGYYAIKLHQSGGAFLRHARAFVFFRGSGPRIRALRERRDRILAAVQALAESR